MKTALHATRLRSAFRPASSSPRLLVSCVDAVAARSPMSPAISATQEAPPIVGIIDSDPVARAALKTLLQPVGVDVVSFDTAESYLLSGSSRKASENRVQELTEITTTLKALAKELEVPIIALSQLSRQVENREDKHPQLADLRESGSIEQDADVVLFVYREEYYLKNKEPKLNTPEHIAWQDEMEKVTGRAEVIIGKQRHGPTGTVQLSFEAQFTRFGNLARDQYLPERFE